MDEEDVERWFGEYLTDYAALGRATADVRLILAHYAVPLVLSSDAGCTVLTDEEQVLAAVRRQVADLSSAGYHRSDELDARTTLLNRCTALRRARFARLRVDGSEISRLEATYLITDAPVGRRISAIVVHSTRDPEDDHHAVSAG